LPERALCIATYFVDNISCFPYPQSAPINHPGNAMPLITSSIKVFLTLCLLAGLTTFSFTSLSFAREPIRTVTGKVTKVSDGDTIQVTTPEQTKLRVRLYGIDAPETPKIDQRTGRVNKPTLWKGILEGSGRQNHGKQIRLDIIEIDQYKRMVGMIWIGSRNINLEMVQEGYAEAYVEHLKEPYRVQFIRAEKEARSARRGVWSLSGNERPSDFRKRLKVRGN